MVQCFHEMIRHTQNLIVDNNYTLCMISWSVGDAIWDLTVVTDVKCSNDHIPELQGCNAIGFTIRKLCNSYFRIEA